MKVMTYSETRQNLASAMDAVVNDAEELVITRTGRESVVMVAKSEWDSIVETDYLMRGANGRRLRRSMAELDAGRGEVHELVEDAG
jgi:antitoxin YefM